MTAVPVPLLSGELLGVQETADRLHVHPNTVRNMVRDGRLRPARPSPGLKFTAAEVDRTWRSLSGRDHAEDDGLPPGTVIGVSITLQLPPGMSPEAAVREVASGIRFGRPETRLAFVVPAAPEQEE
jgi:excisionase family DNA binding protein